MESRRLRAADGTEWEGFATDAIVAHGRAGAALAFRPAGESEGSLLSTVTFNSMAAAEHALRTMSEKEIRRRLSLARQAAAGTQLQAQG